MTSPSGARADAIQAPSRLKLVLEGCGLFDLPALAAATPFLSLAPRGTPQAVLVLPGLGASDRSTFALRGFLASLGHGVHGWGRGRNVRLPQLEIPAIIRQVDQIFAASGAPVSLVGWSLGGILAREVAREIPSRVRMVITLGSPFAAPGANNVRTIWRLLTGQPSTSINAARVAELAKPLPVPATAIYTRSDGVVAWQACLERDGPHSENIEVRTTHIGLGFHAPALWVIADRLALPSGTWTPFRPGALLAPFFPNHR